MLEIKKQFISNLIIENDQGIYDAMNKGIKTARGYYLYFLNAGDVFYAPHVLTEFAKHARPDSLHIMYGDVLRVGSNDQAIEIFSHNHYDFVSLLRRPNNHQAVFASQEVFIKNGTFDLNYRIRADHDWELKNFKDPSVDFQYIPIVVARYYYEGFTSKNKALYDVKERKMLIQKNMSLLSINLNRIFSVFKLIDRSMTIRKLMNYIILHV